MPLDLPGGAKVANHEVPETVEALKVIRKRLAPDRRQRVTR